MEKSIPDYFSVTCQNFLFPEILLVQLLHHNTIQSLYKQYTILTPSDIYSIGCREGNNGADRTHNERTTIDMCTVTKDFLDGSKSVLLVDSFIRNTFFFWGGGGDVARELGDAIKTFRS